MHVSPPPFNIELLFFVSSVFQWRESSTKIVLAVKLAVMFPRRRAGFRMKLIQFGLELLLGRSLSVFASFAAAAGYFTSATSRFRRQKRRKSPWSLLHLFQSMFQQARLFLSQQSHLHFLAPTLYLLAMSSHRPMLSLETMYRFPTEVVGQ